MMLLEKRERDAVREKSMNSSMFHEWENEGRQGRRGISREWVLHALIFASWCELAMNRMSILVRRSADIRTS